MVWNFVIIALVWAGAEFSWGVNYPDLYQEMMQYINEHEVLLAGYSVGGAFGLVVLSYMFRAFGWYSLVFLMSKLAFYLSQFLVCLISYSAVSFWFYVSQNLWADMGYVVAATPFVWLFAASISLWLFDFNYPVAEKIYNNIVVAIISVVVVLAMSFTGFSF